jgi:2-isopropylmalate synthase
MYSQGVDPQLDLSIMDEIIACVEHCTSLPTHPRHPYAGELVFSAFSGGHQHAIHKCLSARKSDDIWDVAYLPVDPKDLGRSYQQLIRINSQSGKGGISYVIENHFGVTMPRWLQLEFRQIVQEHAEADGGELSPDTIWQIFEDNYLYHKTEQLVLINKDIALLKSALATAVEAQGSMSHIDFTSDAFHQQLQTLYQLEIEVLSLDSHQMFEEQDKDYISFVQLSCHGQRVTGAAMVVCGEQATLFAIVSAIRGHLAEQ